RTRRAAVSWRSSCSDLASCPTLRGFANASPQQDAHGTRRPRLESSSMPNDDVDLNAFQDLVARFRRGELRGPELPPESAITPLLERDVDALPEPGAPHYQESLARGEEALARGELACVIVAGGAATRFGGSVKGLVPVYEGRTFLDIKLED